MKTIKWFIENAKVFLALCIAIQIAVLVFNLEIHDTQPSTTELLTLIAAIFIYA